MQFSLLADVIGDTYAVICPCNLYFDIFSRATVHKISKLITILREVLLRFGAVDTLSWLDKAIDLNVSLGDA